MRDILLIAIVFGSLPYAVVRPHVGLLMWSWLGYMNPHRFTWGIAYSFPFVQAAALATLIGFVFVRKERNPFPVTAATVFWTLFVFWVSVTTIFANYPVDAQAEWQRTIKIQVMVLVTLMLMASEYRINALVWVIAGSIGFFGIKGGFFTVITGGKYLVWGPPGSFIEGNNEIAFALLITVPLMAYLRSISKDFWVRNGLVIAMVLSGFAILGSYSRGALLGASAMLFTLWLKSRHKLLSAIGVLVVVASLLAFMPSQWGDRMETIQTYEEDKSAMGRINAWWFAFNLAKDSPIVGGGFQTFRSDIFYRYAPNPEDFHDAHSIYFEVLGEHGFVGLFLFLGMGVATILTGTSIRRRAKKVGELRWAYDLAGMLQVSFVGYATGGAFLGLAYFDLPYHLMAVMALTKVVVEKRLAESVSSPDTARKWGAGRVHPQHSGRFT